MRGNHRLRWVLTVWTRPNKTGGSSWPRRVTIRGMVRRLFTWRMNLLRVLVGAVILAIVLPVQASGYQPLWPVVVGAFLFAIALGILVSHTPIMGAWLGR